MNRRFPSPTICGGEGTREGPPGSGQAGLFWFSNPSKSPTGVEILSQSGPGVCVLVSGVNPDDGRLIGVVWQGVARCGKVLCGKVCGRGSGRQNKKGLPTTPRTIGQHKLNSNAKTHHRNDEIKKEMMTRCHTTKRKHTDSTDSTSNAVLVWCGLSLFVRSFVRSFEEVVAPSLCRYTRYSKSGFVPLLCLFS